MPATYPTPAGTKSVLFEQKVFNWFAGIASGLILLGTGVVGSLLWTTNSSVIALTTKISSMETSEADLKVQLSHATQLNAQRYTVEAAAVDKAALIALLNTSATNLTNLHDALSRRIAEHDKALTDLKVQIATIDKAK